MIRFIKDKKIAFLFHAVFEETSFSHFLCTMDLKTKLSVRIFRTRLFEYVFFGVSNYFSYYFSSVSIFATVGNPCYFILSLFKRRICIHSE